MVDDQALGTTGRLLAEYWEAAKTPRLAFEWREPTMQEVMEPEVLTQISRTKNPSESFLG